MNILIFDSLPSTQTYLKDKITQENLRSTEIVLAKSQTQGIGTYGRKWHSSTPESLLVSFSIPAKKVADKDVLVFFTAYVIHKLLKQEYDIHTQIKWSNDIYLDNKKLSGILVEYLDDMFVVGFGVNLNQEKFTDDIAHNAISLYQKDQIKRDPELLLQQFLMYWEMENSLWKKSPDYFWQDLETLWLYKNTKISVTLLTGEVLVGIFSKVQNNGALIIKTDIGEKEVYAGTVRPL